MFKYFNKNVWDIKRVLYVWRMEKELLEIEVRRLNELLRIQTELTAAYKKYADTIERVYGTART